MSATTRVPVPGLLPGHLALPRLVAQDLEEFASRTWGRRALLSPAAALPQGFGDLLDAAAVDELVSQRGLRTPFLRVARRGSTLPERDFTAGGGVGAAIGDQVSDDRLLRLFADGATMVLQGLHRVWPPIVGFAQQLAADLGHPVQVNAYVTPPQSQGFDDHYDVHDVFVLQIDGDKHWRIHEPVHEAPLRDQPWTDHRAAVEQAAGTEPVIDAVLSPGDCLYLPRGYMHAATALGGVSTHLTIGVHTWTRESVARELVAAALARLVDDVEARRSLPLGADVGSAADIEDDVREVRDRLALALQAVADDDVAARLATRRRAAQRAAPVGPLAQLRAASAVDVPDGDLVLVVRPHLAAAIEPTSAGGAVVRSRAGDLTLAADDVAAVTAFLERGDATSVELGPTLARRLLLAGLAVPR